MHYEIMLQKVLKIGSFLVAGFIQLVNELGETFISNGFDQLFSIGLLMLGVYFIYKEWKKSEQYNEERDQRLEELIENNTEALNNFRREFKNVHDRIDQNRSLINSHHQTKRDEH